MQGTSRCAELKPELFRRTPEATNNMSPWKPLNLSAFFCALCAVTLAHGQMAPAASPAAPTAEELDQAVTQGVQYMASQAEMNLQAVRALQMAIASDNLTGARNSSQHPYDVTCRNCQEMSASGYGVAEAQAVYGRSRAWYEEIEVLAYAFPEVDR